MSSIILIIGVLFSSQIVSFVQSQLYQGGMVDLGWSYDERTVYWPNTRSFVYSKKNAHYDPQGNWYASNEFCAAEHSGTHLDAPFHFYHSGWKVADIPLDHLIGPGFCVNGIHEMTQNGSNTTLTAEHILKFETEHETIRENGIVLFNHGWSQFYGNPDYLGIDSEGVLHFPGISLDAAQLLIDRKVAGVGIDTASIDPGQEQNLEVHRLLAKNNIFILENLKIPSNFPGSGYRIFALPMKLRAGSGAPVRVLSVPNVNLEKSLEEEPLRPGQLFKGNTPQVELMMISSSVHPWYNHSWIILCTLILLAMYTVHCFSF